jgi:hypothetical protein
VIRRARDPHRHLRVLDRAELGQRVVELEDEADAAIAEGDDVSVAHRGQFGAVNRDAALIDAIEATERSSR